MTTIRIDKQEGAGVSLLERGLRGVFTCRGLGRARQNAMAEGCPQVSL